MIQPDCPFTKGVRGHRGFTRRPDCRACGGPLPPYCRVWCSSACEKVWNENHIWGIARDAAVKRDGHRCVKCGADGRTPKWVRESLSVISRAWHRDNPQPEYRSAEYPLWRKRFSQHSREMERVHNSYRLEVNHIVARVGKPIAKSCRNHLDNLETLCHGCHVEVTKQQREERLAS